MNNFSIAKGFGYGALIWGIMFIAISILVGYHFSMGTGWSLALAALSGVLSYVFALATKASNGMQALEYGVFWAVVGILLDLLISYQFQHGIFATWSYWLSYALVIGAPWLEYEIQGTGTHPRAI